jgi:uncharacterized membrane protein YGL010W
VLLVDCPPVAFLRRAGAFLLSVGFLVLLFGIGLNIAGLSWASWVAVGVVLLVLGWLSRGLGKRAERRGA